MSKLITIDYDEYLEMERIYKIIKQEQIHKGYNEEKREKYIGNHELFNLLNENDSWGQSMDRVVISKDGYF